MGFYLLSRKIENYYNSQKLGEFVGTRNYKGHLKIDKKVKR